MGFDVEENHDSRRGSCLGRPQLRVPCAAYVGRVFGRSNSSDIYVCLYLSPMSDTGHRTPNFTLRKNEDRNVPGHAYMVLSGLVGVYSSTLC